MDNPLFYRLMGHSVDLLVALGGETTKVQALVRVMLSALLKYKPFISAAPRRYKLDHAINMINRKLEHKRLKFPKNMFDCIPWVRNSLFAA
jgi:hypothetical protein